MRIGLLTLALLTTGCKGDSDTDTGDPVDCTTEGTSPLSGVAVPDWPAGFEDALAAYQSLDGRWIADACGERINVTMTIVPNEQVDIVTGSLPAGNDCGCTHDRQASKDGDLDVIARATLNLGVDGYPRDEFSLEGAGNVTNVPVAFYQDTSGGLRARACINHLVPPILGSDFDDNLITIRVGDSGVSGTVELQGASVPPDRCELTGWERVGNSQ